jgi:hypothetical protein
LADCTNRFPIHDMIQSQSAVRRKACRAKPLL